ncbi:hypothetical protein AVEN_130346-1 [Araneus ventricosus]|uniref:Uncharacterized protein n=1 Tax=Araneus ventricosus TaxID=182803 RepID=A0A4Y2BD89_ARAVE|nr:hypothetical protein AVEN_130346-1 [Araneus ventricosus]
MGKWAIEALWQSQCRHLKVMCWSLDSKEDPTCVRAWCTLNPVRDKYPPIRVMWKFGEEFRLNIALMQLLNRTLTFSIPEGSRLMEIRCMCGSRAQ